MSHRRSAPEVAALLPQAIGAGGLVVMLVFWLFTRQTEPAFLTTFGGLLAIGQGAEALATARRPQDGEAEG